MATITIEIPEELSAKLSLIQERLPEVLAQSVDQPLLPVQVYRYIVDFLASAPTQQQIADFRPTDEMQERLRLLLSRAQRGELTNLEEIELREFEHIEHLVIMLKTGALSYLSH